jgi:hypothetical protein
MKAEGKKPRIPYNSKRPWLTVEQLADYFQVHRNTLRGCLKRFKPDYDLHSVNDTLDFVIWYAEEKGIVK